MVFLSVAWCFFDMCKISLMPLFHILLYLRCCISLLLILFTHITLPYHQSHRAALPRKLFSQPGVISLFSETPYNICVILNKILDVKAQHEIWGISTQKSQLNHLFYLIL